MFIIRAGSNQSHHRLYRLCDLDDAVPVGLPVVAVQFADVRTVGDLLCISLRVVAHLPGGAVVVPYQAGEIEKGILARVVAAEIQRIGAAFYGRFPAVPISVAAPVCGHSEIVTRLPCQVARAPAAFKRRLCQDGQRIHVESRPLPTKPPAGTLLRS